MQEEINQNSTSNSKVKTILFIIIFLIIVALIVWFVFSWLKNKAEQPSQYVDTNILETQDLPKENNASDLGQVSNFPAHMFLESSNTTLEVGDEIQVDVYFDTLDKNIVVASASLNFDTDKLELIGAGADTTDSDLSLSVMNSVNDGLLQIVRGEPGDANSDDVDDGFTGMGLLAVLKFKVLSSGNASVQFLPAASNLILDDGRGTNLDTNFDNLTLYIR